VAIKRFSTRSGGMARFGRLRYIADSGPVDDPGKSMKKTLLTLILALSCTMACAADKVPAHPHIEVVTTEGTFKLELDGKAAPLTVANFLKLVDSGFYDGTIFHRVIPGFMAQGGGYTPGFKLKKTDETVPNESGNGLSNLRGSIAMARLSDPHSAGSQFFINVANNVGQDAASPNLDPVKHTTRGRWGYTVFGFVFEGMDVVDAIVNAESAPNGPGGAPAPVVPIIIKKMSRITYD
jgi:cyclophilin family peptidyl-prolyl cis-trans isomerase